MDAPIKRESVDAPSSSAEQKRPWTAVDLISLSSDSEDSGDEGCRGAGEGAGSAKRRKVEDVILPLGFLDPLPPEMPEPPPLPLPMPETVALSGRSPSSASRSGYSKQFWKAGDFEGEPSVVDKSASVSALDHVRVHPKFLHSNATSHKWALGAFAELLDNALDEVAHGATFVNVDMLLNKKDNSKMILVEDDGGGMDPDKLRQCMSLGYSAKSKSANTIGQYGNGFKTSTMRLGADVIVFSRGPGKDGKSATQSIGMLSYTFLRDTGKEDIVVPMLDYVKEGPGWNKLIRSSPADWCKNLETIIQWSPYSSEADMLQQFDLLKKDQGTRIVIYNLWEDDRGTLELDFYADKYDIQLGGVNRDEKKIQMANQFPNSRHFLTYQHSLRSYASILYLRLPQNFRMILRGKEIEHHNIVNDMMLTQEITYRPQCADGAPKDPNYVAVVTMGFVKDAKDHIDVQGFNVYHKNRLIKPFWRVWNAAGSDGRGVIGVLEANFVEPAHDKQGFERTTVLSRLEARLVQMQKQYWCQNCHRIGYAPRRGKKAVNGLEERDSSPEGLSRPSPRSLGKDGRSKMSINGKSHSISSAGKIIQSSKQKPIAVKRESLSLSDQSSSSSDSEPDNDRSLHSPITARANGSINASANGTHQNGGFGKTTVQLGSKGTYTESNEVDGLDPQSIQHLKQENQKLKDRIRKMEVKFLHDLEQEKERNKTLKDKLEAAERKLEEANKEQEALIDIFSEERCRRDREEELLRKRNREATTTIQDLLQKLANKNG